MIGCLAWELGGERFGVYTCVVFLVNCKLNPGKSVLPRVAILSFSLSQLAIVG